MSPKESYRETLLGWIGELKDKEPLNQEEQALIKYLYQMLVNEWYEERFVGPYDNEPRKRVQR